MRTLAELRAGKISEYFKAAFVGAPGEGKTHLAGTFPKSVFAVTCPGEIDTILNDEKLSKNLVGWENFIPSTEESAAKMFARLKLFLQNEVRPGIAKGEIKTFVLDNITFLAEYLWEICTTTDRKLYMSNNNNFDALKAYGGLKDMLFKFILKEVLTLPCDVIINVHVQIEDDKKLEKMPTGSMPHVAAILGAFRDKLPGMVSYFFFLDKKEVNVKMPDGKFAKAYQYNVLTNKGNGRSARTRLKLPQKITNASYDVLMKHINEARTLKG